ncbi:MAG TPA: FAD-binding oxidoreductase [bacterium]
MSAGDLLAQRINGDVGAGLASDSAEALAATSIAGLAPKAAVFPKTEAHVAALLAFANRGGWKVVPWGSGSTRPGASTPQRYDIALVLTGLGQVLDHDSENLTLTAQSGLALAEANRQLAPKHQFLPLGFASERRTLGGLIAANRTPPQRLVYGDARDQILGIRVAMADGSLVRFGRKVLKNVAGYDMNKVFLGSEGQLGVIVEVTMKLAALPDTAGYLAGSFAKAQDAFTAAGQCFRSALQPSGIFVLDDAASAAWRSAQGLPATGGTTLLVSFEGRGVTVKRQLADGGKLMTAGGASTVTALERLTDAGIHLLSRPGGADPSADLILRIGTAPTALLAVWDDLATTLGAAGLARAADYGSGQIAASTKRALLDGAVSGKIEALRGRVAAQRGYLVVQAAPPELRAKLSSWGDLGGEATLLRALKAKFDPNAILAPGRFIA